MKKTSLFFIIGIGIGVAVWFAAGRKESFKPVNTNADNIAVRGFDTVAYFTEGLAEQGNPQFAYDWNGAKWYFKSAENLEKFKSDPESFAPQFGGYCAWAVSRGYTADGDPNEWKIVNGKLYLNYDRQVKEKWEAEQEKSITDGEKNWLKFKTKKPEHKG